MTRPTHREKRDAMLELLDRGLVMVHLDPRHPSVQVPEWFKTDPTLRLNIAYGFNLPALEVDEEGIYAVLSFGGQNHGCSLPWEAVFALTLPDEQHDGQVWPDSLPKELIETISAVEALAEEQPRPEPVSHLRVVDSGGDTELDRDATVDPSALPDASHEAKAPGDDQERAPAKLRLVTD